MKLADIARNVDDTGRHEFNAAVPRAADCNPVLPSNGVSNLHQLCRSLKTAPDFDKRRSKRSGMAQRSTNSAAAQNSFNHVSC
jgi:hypothetical protein